MEEFKKKKKIVTAFGIFLIFMFVCTIISKGVYTSGLPQIETRVPESTSILHSVLAEGSVRQGKETAVNILNGLRVEEIFVHEGENVNVGDALLSVDMQDLKGQIREMERSLSKLEMQIKNLQTNEENEKQKKNTEIQRAKEDYQNVCEETDRNLAQAEEMLRQAREALKEHEKNPVSVTSEEERKKKEETYKEWMKKKQQLEEALAKAEKEKEEAQLVWEEVYQQLEKAKEQGESQESIEILKKQLDEADAMLKEKIKNEEIAAEALNKHKENPVEKPDYSEEDAKKAAWEAKKQQLQEEVKNKEKIQEEAGYEKESGLKKSQRILEDAMQPVNADSTLSIYQLDYQEQEETLKKYNEILKAEGKICADKEGMITLLNVQIGERTTDSPIIKIADTDCELLFRTTISEEQKKYINKGDAAKINWMNGGSEKGIIDYLSENHLAAGTYDITVILPKGAANIGQSGTLSVSYRSKNYPVCIPTDAVYTDGNQRKFVFVLSKKDGILGEELAARKVYVTILEQNNNYTAIEEGIIDGNTEVIVSATKELKDGSIVRYMEW